MSVKKHLGRQKSRIRPLQLAVVAFAITTVSCQAPDKTRMLPDAPPEVAVLKFGGADGGWPPLPVDAQKITLVPWSTPTAALTEPLKVQIQQAALADLRVQGLLGERFAYIGTDQMDGEKSTANQIESEVATRVTFYSYSNNVAIEARMYGSKVESVQKREGYQPPESPDEIKFAIQFAREDPRIQKDVEDLEGDALITFPQKGHPGYGNRVLYVGFAKKGEGLARYMALVDLTAQKLLEAGPTAGM